MIREMIASVKRQFLRSDLGGVAAAILLLIGIGTVVYDLIEDWTLAEALYATVITITTVGYGDYSPQTAVGRAFAIGFTLVAIAIGGYALSTLAAGVIERQAMLLEKRMRRRRMDRLSKMKDHIIVCGSEQVGMRIARELYARGVPFVIVEPDEYWLNRTLKYIAPDFFERARESLRTFDEIAELDSGRTLAEEADALGVTYLQADPGEEVVLRRAGIERARALIATLPADRDNLAVVVSARGLAKRFGNPDMPIMARVEDERFIRKMFLAGATYVRMPALTGGFQMASHILDEAFGAWWYEMVLGDPDLRFSDRVAPSEWVGRTIDSLRHERDVIVLAIRREDRFLTVPSPDEVIQAGDVLILLGRVG
ncbi:MAG: potassium channel family protein [Anaerolineae bacterium]